MELIHNTTCHLDFNEQIKMRDLIYDIRRLNSFCDQAQENDESPSFIATALCGILDTINELKEHSSIIYPIFDKFDKLALCVKGLPK